MTEIEWAYDKFPNLKRRGSGFAITSPRDPSYNCIAWAAGDATKYWWPADDAHWPKNVVKECTIQAFSDAFSTLNYVECADGTLEAGFEKLALYAKDGKPTHMARQLAMGTWTSKLGNSNDISHDSPAGVSGTSYGTVIKFMRRKI